MRIIHSCHKYLVNILNVSDAILIIGKAEMDYMDAVGVFHHSKWEKHPSPLFPLPIYSTDSAFNSTLHVKPYFVMKEKWPRGTVIELRTSECPFHLE